MTRHSGLLSIYNHWSKFLFTGVLALLSFDLYLFLMLRFPGVTHGVEACVLGGSLTLANLIFSAVLSVSTAILLMGMHALYHRRAFGKKVWATGGSLGFGFLLGFFTVFCTLCTLPVLSVFGLAVGLSFFTTHNVLFKVLSLVAMAFALWLMDGQLRACKRCVD